jgi:N-acetylornithine carbamoyltransferase
MRHFTHLDDLGPKGQAALLQLAADFKRNEPGALLKGKVLGMLFFNPSLRTRTSFEVAMLKLGGQAVALEEGSGVWKVETEDGAVMNADKAEHVREAAPVLSRYVDALGVRAFSRGMGQADDDIDGVINAFRRHAKVPMVSLESAREHPCQGLADMLTVHESFGQTQGVKVVLSWAPHVKPLAKAVPNSVLLHAAAAGCDITVAHPPGFELGEAVRAQAQRYAGESGAKIRYTHDQREALQGAHVVYAKAWGPEPRASEDSIVASPALRGWMPTLKHFEHCTSEAIFLHCLPVRRNVEISDEVLDSEFSRVIDEAENRLWVQMAALAWLFGKA